MKKITAGIIGGAGYTGGETLRLLLGHPHVDITFVQSRSQAGKPVTSTHGDLLGDTDLVYSAGFDQPVDVLFLCLSHGESKKLLAENSVADHTKIIDLGNDFRLEGTTARREFIYGLPELQRERIKSAKNIANPGCFATTIELGLLPLAKAGLLKDVHTTGITGSTGAGQKLQDTTHFTWRVNNISPYKTLTHQHLGEIYQTLKSLQTDFSGEVNFIPWRGDFARGIFVTSTMTCDLNQEELVKLYKDFYNGDPFTFFSESEINLKQVVNTNKCLIHIEKVGNKVAIHSMLDNLVKGASGQAVQNMNLMFDFEETAGLKLKSIVF